MLDKSVLLELFNYDKDGLSWKISPAFRVKAGDRVTSNTVRVKKKTTTTARVVWTLHNSPTNKKIWHIDGNSKNNKIENLELMNSPVKTTLSQERLKKLLNYDKQTGIFTHKTTRGTALKNSEVRNLNDKGYVGIGVDNKTYTAHRLAWLYEYGYMPENDIDHINKNRADNRLINLREVSRQCNMRNTNNRKSNKSTIKGLHWSQGHNGYVVQISVNYKKIWIGKSSCLLEAACLRLAAEQCLNWGACDETSPAATYVKERLQNER